ERRGDQDGIGLAPGIGSPRGGDRVDGRHPRSLAWGDGVGLAPSGFTASARRPQPRSTPLIWILNGLRCGYPQAWRSPCPTEAVLADVGNPACGYVTQETMIPPT